MEILKGVEIIGKSLWLQKQKTLIIADFHLGYEEALNKQGILVPRTMFKQTEKELKEILRKVKPEKIIINGDLKHEFGEISRQEWHEAIATINMLLENCEELILIKGNHDTILEPIAKKKNLKIVNYYCLDDICILHGHKILNNIDIAKSKTLIIAHEHPAINLREGAKTEKYKCFLLGKWNGKKLIVMPSFLPLIEGTDIKKEKLLSPYLKQNINNFEVFVVSDKTYEFGKLKDI